MEDPSFTNLYWRSIRRRRRLKEEPIKPSRQEKSAPVTILHTGTMFKTITSPHTGNLIWVNSSKTPIGDQDDVTITTATESSSSCRSTSLSGFTVNLESDSDGSNESQLKPIQERVATHKPRPILKKRSTSEPRYICSRKSHWVCLPPPTDLPEEVPLSTSFKRSRSVRVDDIGRIEKHVGFGRIHFRSYQQTVGDNPAVSYGFPISLDWEYEEDGEMQVDDYELQKGTRRRNTKQLAMSYYKRKSRLLEEYGIEKEELERARKDCNKAKFRRGVTTLTLPIWKVEDILESTGRKAKRALGRKKE